MIPNRVPRDLVRQAFPVNQDDEEGLAWSRDLALEVIGALEPSKIAILSVEVYRTEAWGLIPTDENLTCDRFLGETATEFAGRSRAEAWTYVDERTDSEDELFLFEFSDQQEAA